MIKICQNITSAGSDCSGVICVFFAHPLFVLQAPVASAQGREYLEQQINKN